MSTFESALESDFESELEEEGGVAPSITIQIVPPRPNISDLVDYLDVTVRARGRVTVPTQAVDFLAKLAYNKPTWWERLWAVPLKVFPKVRVTVELVQVGISLFPISHYVTNPLFNQGLNEYMLRLHSKNPPCSIDYVTVIGGAFRIMTKEKLEKDLGINGQLDRLLRTAIKLPISQKDAESYFWLVYATFPTEIRKYVIPEGRIVLDEFVFDKSTLTKVHIQKILAIARHVVAMMRFIAPARLPAIELAGHTDSRGTEKYNIDLGARRASEVQKALRTAIDRIRPGLSSQITITPKSFGETRPLVKARTEAEHARNRRVEVLLPKLRPRCPRVSLRAVVNRALGLLPRLATPEQAQRISCLLRKVTQRGADDRWVYPELAQDVYNGSKPPGTYSFTLLRDQLSNEGIFGSAAPDAVILRNLESIDGRIIQGITIVNQMVQRLALAASQGIRLESTAKAVDALRAWMYERVKTERSIYSCYRNV